MGFLDGFTKGITKGITYVGQFVSSFVWSVEHVATNHAPLNDLVPIAKVFVSEVLDTSGNILPNVVGALITGGDPFAGSRHQFQNWQNKYGKH